MGAQDKTPGPMARQVGIERLVGADIPEHGVAVDARFVGEDPFSHHRLASGDGFSGSIGHHAAQVQQLRRVHPGVEL